MLLSTLSVALLLWMSPSASGVKVGQKAHDFSLEALSSASRRPVSLEQYRGSVIMLDFWATWCEPCRDELPELARLQKKYSREKFVVIAINVDNEAETARAFLQKYNIELFAVWDRNKSVVSRYDVQRMPSCYLIDANGKVRFIHYGFEDGYVAAYKNQIELLLNEASNGNRSDKNAGR
jgi:thiol-disulfide isomerase/thioredoxin